MKRRAAVTCAIVLGLSAAMATAPTTSAATGLDRMCAAPSPPTSGSDSTSLGIKEYEAWLTTDKSQRDLDALQRLVDRHTPTGTPENSFVEQYDTPVLGFVPDHRAQRYLLAVDPQRVNIAQLRSELARETPDAPVQIVASCHRSQQVGEAARALVSMSWSPTAKTSQFGMHLDTATGRIVVTFRDADRTAADALKRRYGDLVQVDFGNPTRRTRGNDGEPHWGGSGIHVNTGGTNDCTSAFTVVKAGVRQMLTAGHCAGNSQPIYSGTAYYGTTHNKASFPTYDMVLIGPNGETYSRSFYADPIQAYGYTASDSNPSLNQFVCASGAFTKGICGVKVTSTSATLCAGGCTGNLFYAQHSDHSRLVGQGGDSGAPVFTWAGGFSATMNGMEIGGAHSWDLYAHKVATIEYALGVSIANT